MISIRRCTSTDENEYAFFSGVIDTAELSAAAASVSCARLVLTEGIQAYFELTDGASGRRIELVQYREGTGAWTEMKDTGTGICKTDGIDSGSRWSLVLRNTSRLTGKDPGEREVVVQIRTMADLAISVTKGTWWLPGDLHMHSRNSDGALFPDALFSLARENGLAYMALTDHQIFYPGEDHGQPVRLSGIEITSSAGHLNCIGSSGWSGLAEDAAGGLALLSCEWLRHMAQKWRESGAAVMINHPCFEPWHWRCDELAEKWFDALEIICDPAHERSPEASERALELWNSMLNKGWDIGGTGGSDYHDLPGMPGFPLTFIRCGSPLPGRDELLSSLKKGRVAAGCGFLAVLQAEVRAGKDVLKWKPVIRPVDHPSADTVFPLRCELIICGTKVSSQVLFSAYDGSGKLIGGINKYIESCGEKCWIRLDCRNSKGQLTGFSEVIRIKSLIHDNDNNNNSNNGTAGEGGSV